MSQVFSSNCRSQPYKIRPVDSAGALYSPFLVHCIQSGYSRISNTPFTKLKFFLMYSRLLFLSSMVFDKVASMYLGFNDTAKVEAVKCEQGKYFS